MAKTLVGLEITQESVRAVEVSTGRAPVMLASGEVRLPRGAARDSEVLDPDAVALALRQLWSRAGITGRRVVLAIGGRRVLVREYTTQAMRPDLLRRALPYQVQDLLPVPAEQAVLDFWPVAEGGGQVTGLLVAAVAETVETIVQTLAKAKLQVVAVDLAAFGLARAAREIAGDQTVAMVHIGDHTTQVVITTGGVPHLVRVLPIDMPTTAVLGAADGVDLDAALERMLETVPAGGDAAPSVRRAPLRPQAPAAIDPAVLDLVDRVRATLGFHAQRPGAPRVSALHLSGAGARIDGLRGALIGALDLPVSEVEVPGILPQRPERRAEAEAGLALVALAGVLRGETR